MLVSDDDAADGMWNAAIEKLPSEIGRLAKVLEKENGSPY